MLIGPKAYVERRLLISRSPCSYSFCASETQVSPCFWDFYAIHKLHPCTRGGPLGVFSIGSQGMKRSLAGNTLALLFDIKFLSADIYFSFREYDGFAGCENVSQPSLSLVSFFVVHANERQERFRIGNPIHFSPGHVETRRCFS